MDSSQDINKMPEKLKRAHILIKVLGWLNILKAVYGGMVFVTSGILSFLEISGDDMDLGFSWLAFGLGILIIGILSGFLFLKTAKGIEQRKSGWKVVGIILGIISLPSIPVGTILGIFILIGLMSDEADSWFVS